MIARWKAWAGFTDAWLGNRIRYVSIAKGLRRGPRFSISSSCAYSHMTSNPPEGRNGSRGLSPCQRSLSLSLELYTFGQRLPVGMTTEGQSRGSMVLWSASSFLAQDHSKRLKRFLGDITHFLQAYGRNMWKVLRFQSKSPISLTICYGNTQCLNQSHLFGLLLLMYLFIYLCSWRYSYVIGTILRSQNFIPRSKSGFGQRTLLKGHTMSSSCNFCVFLVMEAM